MKRNKFAIAGLAVLGAGSLALTGCGPADSDGGGEEAAGPEFGLAYNADGGHQAWVDATVNSIAGALDIKAVGVPYPDFAGFREEVTNRTIESAFRTGWQADYPGLYNFLGPLYATNASANDGDYSSEEFDSLLEEGISTEDPEAANELYLQAQDVLLKDLPAIPLWYSNVVGGWSENVDNVAFSWRSVPIFEEITKDDGVVTANGSEPQNPLIPTNTNETGGGKILDAMFTGLISYDADGAVVNDVAEEITVDSPTQLTVKLREGLTFTNGEEITADNFINAWNYGAEQENAQLNSYFFEDIEGFENDDNGTPDDTEDDLYGAQGDGLSGLNQIDDYTFEITLNKPAADFAQRLGYSAYYPLPDVAFEDMEAFGENPIGNGPYMPDGEGAWEHDVKIDLAVNPDYDGPRTAQNDGLQIVFYSTQEAAYNDLLANNLDVLDAIPDSAFETYQDELGDRWVNDPAAIFQSFTIAENLEHFSGEEGQLRRQAISMAIDREAITDKIFQGTRTPASDFTSPVIDGWTDQLEGESVLEYNPEKAKELWEQANEISPWE
ncbi:ABC transporter substrate-binding protein [Microbacterium sp. JB110]|uniref:ABC transporter substrate-binding protein n=1 Tax=Microbacterium sp. JB110 TaxID=2024477 RepID=UPI00097EC204|nr:ABC transporter substrate-binding protein [Microbacterium sp. JB110]SJM67014.1 Dipeptide-binding ABC transporter, periplasmic substrate-binding component (TC 3.A.1.5.2) [Frigoribacterium sp. JB110]